MYLIEFSNIINVQLSHIMAGCFDVLMTHQVLEPDDVQAIFDC